MDELELELKTTFLGQAQQLVAEAEQCFLDLESNPGDIKILDRIFRIMHNMKGSANGLHGDRRVLAYF
jgi:two-component system, chemotaxis family, sensor kinase CheA